MSLRAKRSNPFFEIASSPSASRNDKALNAFVLEAINNIPELRIIKDFGGKGRKMKIAKFYNKIWDTFQEDEFEEAVKLLKHKLEISDIKVSGMVLDVGCGSGRYSYALSKLGAKEVWATDLIRPKIIKDYKFKKGSAFNLPFNDNEFDFVFCNGVLHHTSDWKKGLRECIRVMKMRGGVMWLLLYKKNTLYSKIDKVRHKLNRDDINRIREFFIQRGWPKSKVFFLCDMLGVPFRTYHTFEQVKSFVKKQGCESEEFNGLEPHLNLYVKITKKEK